LDNSTYNSINLSKMSMKGNENVMPKNDLLRSSLKLEELNFLMENCQMKCERCSRKFDNKVSHMKHSKNCHKVFGSKRAPFESKKQRMDWMMMNNMNMEQLYGKDKELCAKIENMNARINGGIEKLKKVMGKWKRACTKLNSKLTCNRGRSFKELYVEINKKECENCHREFNDISYLKHAPHCMKLTNKRKPFDSRKQRIVNLEHAVFIRRREILSQNDMGMSKISMNKRWKKMSERFRTIMRISRLLHRKD
jgi:hypothetical protein